MSAQRAYREYGNKYKSMKKRGNKITMRDSTGDSKMTVDKNTKVYHRGNGNFARYSRAADKKRSARGVKQIKPQKKNYKVGYGKYRHTSDGKK